MNERGPTPGSIEAKMIDSLEKWAKKHANNSNGLLSVIERTSPNFPTELESQITGIASDDSITDLLAETAFPEHYPVMKNYVSEAERNSSEISRIGELLKDGNNLIVVSNHGDLVDIALAQAAIYGELYRLGYRPETGIVINEMAKFLSYKVDDTYIPAIDVLKLLDTNTFLSYPTTPSTDSYLRNTTMTAIMKNNNRKMRHGFAAKLKEGGQLMAIAASGTTDKLDDDNPSLVHLGEVSRATRNMLSHERTFILPVALHYGQGSKTFFEFASIPKPIDPNNNMNEANAVMHLIANSLSEGVDGLDFIYDEPEN